MEIISYYVTAVSFAIVILCWFVFAGTFLFRKKPADATPDSKSAPKSIFGLALQGMAFGLAWAFRRQPVFSPFINEVYLLNIVLQIVAVLSAAGSVWLAKSAIRELGKQWSLEARLVENHQLITSGVYQIVRHPIYTAMLGLLIATSFIFSDWRAALAGLIVFCIGTKIRTISEEKLLREAFPDQYRDYAAKVPAFIPFVKI